MARSEKALGRGISALFDDAPSKASNVNQPASAPSPTEVSIAQISVNPDQPRKRFDPEALAELSSSIAEKGVLQPILVRDLGGEKYQVVAGERRFRAAQKAGLHSLPAVIRKLSDDEVLQIGLIENIQRDDLTPIEEARAYSQLIERFGHTQEVLAKQLGKSRPHIANMLRLMRLPAPAVRALEDGLITAGHARAVLASDKPLALLKKIVKSDLSVRQAEKLAKNGITASTAPKTKDADTRALEKRLQAATGLKISIEHANGEAGKVVINYRGLDQLDEICKKLEK